MAKSSLEKALEKQQREAKQLERKRQQAEKRVADKQQREARRLAEKEARVQQAFSIVNGQPVIGDMRVADETAEEIIKIINGLYDGNEGFSVCGNEETVFPSYIQNNLYLEFEKLKQYGLLMDYNIYYNSVWRVQISPKMLNYFTDKEAAIKKEEEKKTMVSIENIYAANGNVVIGNVVNSQLSVDNSIKRIESIIEERGLDDKEELYQLLGEAKELIENLKETRYIPKNKGLFNRISQHLEKHGWFYGEIVGLLGTAAITLLGI